MLQMVSIFRVFLPYICTGFSSLACVLYVLSVTTSWFYHLNRIWKEVQSNLSKIVETACLTLNFHTENYFGSTTRNSGWQISFLVSHFNNILLLRICLMLVYKKNFLVTILHPFLSSQKRGFLFWFHWIIAGVTFIWIRLWYMTHWEELES
jgi:hypothetical protein